MGPCDSATPLSRKSGEHRIQAHSHYSIRRPSDVAHKASRHNSSFLEKDRGGLGSTKVDSRSLHRSIPTFSTSDPPASQPSSEHYQMQRQSQGYRVRRPYKRKNSQTLNNPQLTGTNERFPCERVYTPAAPTGSHRRYSLNDTRQKKKTSPYGSALNETPRWPYPRLRRSSRLSLLQIR